MSPCTRRPSRSKRYAARRGVTFLEVVLATVLLAMVSSSVCAALTYIARSESRYHKRLGGYEVANRLLLQYLDDKKAMPSEAAHYDDGRYNYRWELKSRPVKLELPHNGISNLPTHGPALNAIDATRLLHVRVYEGIPDGVGGYARGEMLAELQRVFNPLNMMAGNPDRRERLARDPEYMAFMRETALGLAAPPGTAPGPGAPVAPAPPGPGTPAAPTPTPGPTQAPSGGAPR